MTRLLPLAIFAFLSLCLQTLCEQPALVGNVVPPRVVIIVCAVPNTSPLHIHCLARGNDLGAKTLIDGQEYYWEVNIPNNPTEAQYPIYFCSFKSGSKEKTLAVYDVKIDPLCENKGKHECYWFVSEDGFFFSNVGSNYRKIADWA